MDVEDLMDRAMEMSAEMGDSVAEESVSPEPETPSENTPVPQTDENTPEEESPEESVPTPDDPIEDVEEHVAEQDDLPESEEVPLSEDEDVSDPVDPSEVADDMPEADEPEQTPEDPVETIEEPESTDDGEVQSEGTDESGDSGSDPEPVEVETPEPPAEPDLEDSLDDSEPDDDAMVPEDSFRPPSDPVELVDTLDIPETESLRMERTRFRDDAPVASESLGTPQDEFLRVDSVEQSGDDNDYWPTAERDTAPPDFGDMESVVREGFAETRAIFQAQLQDSIARANFELDVLGGD